MDRYHKSKKEKETWQDRDYEVIFQSFDGEEFVLDTCLTRDLAIDGANEFALAASNGLVIAKSIQGERLLAIRVD